MSVKVKCTECGKVLAVPDTARGKAVKCPQCQTRIAVPAESGESKSSSESTLTKTSKSKVKKASKPLDSEASLLAFDMSRAEDSGARICTKCGFDMKYQDEEDTECSKCGFDSTIGGMGTRARKKAMKGPDPSDFYPGLLKDALKFVGRNKGLAIRTVIYTVVCLLLSELFCVAFFWISMWPTRVFLALCFLISFMVIPGWMWVLDTEIIKLTLERKDKFKKLNFDFFLSSAMGAAFVAWCFVVALPLALLPSLIGFVMVKYGHLPDYVMYIMIGIGLIPAAFVFPVCMAHMSMPVQFRGWQFWNVVRISINNVKPLAFCLLWLIITNLVNLTGVTLIGVLYGSSLASAVSVMEENAEINRARFIMQENPNAKLKKKGDPNVKTEAEKLRDAVEATSKKEHGAVNYGVLIVPTIILLVMCAVNGFTGMINMRIHGQFTYYNKGALELVDRLKEYKYIAKEKVDEDEEAMKPKTLKKLVVDALSFVLVFDLLGLVGGMLYGNLTSAGMGNGILLGLCIGGVLAMFVTYIMNTVVAFGTSPVWGSISLFTYPIGFIVYVFKNWEERKGPFIQLLFAQIPGTILLIVGFASGVFFSLGGSSGGPAAPPAGAAPPVGAPNMDPSQMQGSSAPGSSSAPPAAAPPPTAPQ